MEFVRVSQNAWGQTEVLGAAWDPLWVFAAAGAAIVLVHALAKAMQRKGAGKVADT